VYPEWAGPCNAMSSILIKVKNQQQNDSSALHFAAASTQAVDELHIFKETCKPTWLFFASGELVGWMHGANAPLIKKLINQHINREKQVLEGKELRQVKDLADAVPVIDEIDYDTELQVPENYRIIFTNEEFIDKSEFNKYYIADAGSKILDMKTCSELKAPDMEMLQNMPSHILVAIKKTNLSIILTEITETENDVKENAETLKNFNGFFLDLDQVVSEHFIKRFYSREIRNDKYREEEQKPRKAVWAVSRKVKNIIKIRNCMKR